MFCVSWAGRAYLRDGCLRAISMRRNLSVYMAARLFAHEPLRPSAEASFLAYGAQTGLSRCKASEQMKMSGSLDPRFSVPAWAWSPRRSSLSSSRAEPSSSRSMFVTGIAQTSANGASQACGALSPAATTSTN